jgi:hypothetical protein
MREPAVALAASTFSDGALGNFLSFLAIFNQSLEEFAAVTVDLRVHA